MTFTEPTVNEGVMSKTRCIRKGQRFGRRVVIDFVLGKSGRNYAVCRCDCGHVGRVRIAKLLAGRAQRCFDCAKPPGNLKHGEHGSPEYLSYAGMLNRCERRSKSNFHRYAGVSVCERWIGETGFENFLSDMGRKPEPRYSLDRIDNTGDYAPENCRWATPKQQARNRRNTMMLTVAGVTKPVVEWAEITGTKYYTLRKRVLSGWTPEEAVSGKRAVSRPKQRIRCDTPYLTVNGERRTMREWAEIGGIQKTTLKARIRKLGWTPEEAVFGRKR